MAELTMSGSSKKAISSTSSSGNASDPDYVANLSSQCSNKNVELKDSRKWKCSSTASRKRKKTSSADVSLSSSVAQEEHRKNETEDISSEIQSTRRTSLGKTLRTFDRKKTQQNHNGSSKAGNRVNDQERRKKATIYSWLMELKIIKENRIVQFKEENGKLQHKGKIRREGIECDCCSALVTATDFCDHSDRKTKSPFKMIYVSRGPDLSSLMARAWEKPEESQRRKSNIILAKDGDPDMYDDACVICADGGNLICCENCNSTYHYSCVGLEEEPKDSYYCPYCVCKFCANAAQPNENVLICPLCARKYHWDCHLKDESIDMNSVSCAPYCERSCKEIMENLEQIVGVQNELGDGYSWTLLHRMEPNSGSVYIEDTYKRTICHAKLAVAYRLMNDCFNNIKDRHTRIDVVQGVIYNCSANFNRINFKGFFTAILEKGDEVVTAASLRIHGTKLVEMPFIATSEVFRGRGMCRRLMTAIESTLSFLKVECLVIPSTPERIGTWTNSYGFRVIEDGMMKEVMKWNTLMFHDSTRLQKSLTLSDTSSVVQKENISTEREHLNSGSIPNVQDEHLNSGSIPNVQDEHLNSGSIPNVQDEHLNSGSIPNVQDEHLNSQPSWEEFLDLNLMPAQL